MPSDIEKRLCALEEAHRALSAQHTALIEVFKAAAPFMRIDRSGLRPVLTIAYDTIDALMQEDGFDEAYQAEVRHWLDVLSRRVLECRHGARPSPGE